MNQKRFITFTLIAAVILIILIMIFASLLATNHNANAQIVDWPTPMKTINGYFCSAASPASLQNPGCNAYLRSVATPQPPQRFKPWYDQH